jgi:hypothetical protein
MTSTRVKISSVIENQLPDFVREEFPLVEEFLSTYYSSLENDGQAIDILQNIDQYVKLDKLTDLTTSTQLTSAVSLVDNTISVLSTEGFPNSYGLIKIDDEIITYTSKTSTTFENCIRGFSGVTSYQNPKQKDHLVFSSSNVSQHLQDTEVSNLSVLFLNEFFKKVKKQFAPGFDDRELYSGLNKNLFIKQARDFYSSKGTDQSFEILFRALYGEDVTVIKPRDYLFIPSNSQYRVVKDLVVEVLSGEENVNEVLNRTLYQDETSVSNKAFGSINKIEKIFRGEKEYYVISLDYSRNYGDTNSGEFSIHPTTKITSPVSIGSSVIDVDSTLGFPNSGKLVIDLENRTSVIVNYKSKSYTQFYECTGVTQNIPSKEDARFDDYAYTYVGFGTSNQVKFRVTGVLSEVNVNETKLFSEGERIKIDTLGKVDNSPVANNWIFNIPINYDVEFVSLIDNANYTYQVKTFDQNLFFVGDSVYLFLTNGNKITTNIASIINSKTFNISGQGEIDASKVYQVEKVLSKGNFKNFPGASAYTSNIQNVYFNKNDEYLVTSSSIANYLGSQLETKNEIVTFNITISGQQNLSIGNHKFLTGDSIYYKPPSSDNSFYDELFGKNLDEGIYFVKRVDSTTIKLARSRENLYKNIFITLSGTVTENQIMPSDFYGKNLMSQKLVRTLRNPIDDSEINETNYGKIGILANGVEILNYKSDDNVYYGPIDKINVLSPGEDYDVISPPVLSISDSIGSGVKGYCEVEGSLESILVIDGGFNYIQKPIISILGGNGNGATAEPELIPYEHSVSFNSTEALNFVNLTDNTISFSTYHKFFDAEKIIYKTKNQQAIGGLTTESTYYAFVQDENTIKLHNTYGDATVGINTIDLTSYGVGIHIFASESLKRKINSVKITNSGSGYKNRKIAVSPSGINTSTNIISAPEHNYSTGEIVVYSATEEEIVGLSSGKSYFITKVDKDRFKLSKVGTYSTIGIGSAVVGVTTNLDFYFRTNQYVDFKSTGSGTHIFNHEPITVNVTGVVGLSTRTGQKFEAVLQPIFRGEIKSVFIETGGTNYGSEDILNFNRQPTFTLNSGKDAQLFPIISSGKITQVIVFNGGSGYNSTPSLEVISGVTSARGAILTPVISNGSITEIKVIDGGSGFSTSTTSVNVIPSGTGAVLQSFAKKWVINLVEKNITYDSISDDDGIIISGIGTEYGLQYTHAYCPRKLRRTLGRNVNINETESFYSDLRLDRGAETLSNIHSPIIGWAYDGNPIYGPYGYSSLSGGSIKLLQSGYTLQLKENRPNISKYPVGFFVNDYEYTNSGDLDEFNGRFCVTPEYPNGVYAYFATINPDSTEPLGAFKDYRKPVFPYLIGNKFKSKPISENFSTKSHQDKIDLNNGVYSRNTKPYYLKNTKSRYSFIVEPNKIKIQNSIVKKTKVGKLDYIGINSSGSNYRMGDRVIFDNTNTQGGQGASFQVSRIKGKAVNQVSSSTTSISNIEFVPSNITERGLFFGFCETPHNLSDLDIINVSGINTFGSGLNGSYNIRVTNDTLTLVSAAESATSTGIVTYFSVTGTLNYPYVRENDILGIGTEKVKVLNVEPELGRIRVLREYDNTVGSSHTLSSILTPKSRKFTFKTKTTEVYTPTYNSEFYFNPTDSVGLGTIEGIGIGYTIFFSNPGFGRTSLYIPTKTIFLPNNSFFTGDSLIYSNNGGTSISVSTNGVSSFELQDNQIVYAAVNKNNLIGISTNPMGVGSTGKFVGLDTSIFTNTLYFTGIGTGEIHSFKTRQESIKGSISKNLITVSTASSHGLINKDSVTVSCLSGLTTSHQVRYNPYHRRMVLNPKNFSSGDVNISENKITIISHKFDNAQKVIYTENSLVGGLENNKIYYAVIIDDNNFKLAETFYNATLEEPICIDMTSQGSGTFSQINPKITAFKNQYISFDVSHSSLSQFINFVPNSAFNFDIYEDAKLKNIFNKSKISTTFEVIKTGTVGITSNATVSLYISDNIPKSLYYGLTPINKNRNLTENLEIITDDENILGNNQIVINDSVYSGTYAISGVTSTSFSYNVKDKPEVSSYLSSEAKLSYTTDSFSVKGPIDGFKVISQGTQYKNLPNIVSVSSSEGKGALVTPYSIDVGKIFASEIEDIGFDYSVDRTIRPSIQFPQVLHVDPFFSLDYIGITSSGKNYTKAPKLVVLDSTRNEVLDEIELFYNLGDTNVYIVRNSAKLSENIPTIIPTNNTNGIGINSISYNQSTKDVTVSLGTTYSNSSDYPFSVGDEVLIEGISVGVGNTYRGYNSKSYTYSLFKLTSVDANVGGTPTVTYSLAELLENNEVPGNFDSTNSSGIIVPKKFFPIFDVFLGRNDFYNKEEVVSNNSKGVVIGTSPLSEVLKVQSEDDFNVGDIIRGSSSNTHGVILSVEKYSGDYSIESNSIVKQGSQTESGFLNNSYQKIHDSDYYQFFSYSIKSKIAYDTWDEVVNSQNHTLGFKKFGDLIVESSPDFAGIIPEQIYGDFAILGDYSEVIGFNKINDFDFVKEKTIIIDSQVFSDELILQNVEADNYIQSISNRALRIDDIDTQFNSEQRLDRFSIVNSFNVPSDSSKKYIISVSDRRFTGEKQLSMVTILNSGDYSYVNQYANTPTVNDLGSFDVSIIGSEYNLLFYPYQYDTNNFNINYISYDLRDSILGISTLSLGNVFKVQTSNNTLSESSTSEKTVVSISTAYAASKVLIQISSDSTNYCEYNEISIIHNNDDISFIEYGQFNTGFSASSSSGIGTYGVSISGSNLNISFTPNEALTSQHTVNAIVYSLSDSGTLTDSLNITTNQLKSSYVSLGSTPSPQEKVICEYDKRDFDSSYYIISVSDKANNRKQMSEAIVVGNTIDSYILEYGRITTSDNLGEVSSKISGDMVQLCFTPIANTELEIRVFENILGLGITNPGSSTPIDLSSGSIKTGSSLYDSTSSNIKRQFNLTNKNLPIFERTFSGNDSNIVNITKNTIRIPNHFFVTGEKLNYSYEGELARPIGIAETSVGVGLTDKLLSEVYAIKVNDSTIKLASTAEKALRKVPEPINITSVGIGSVHKLTSTNQNSKSLITIDNVIQSPVVSTAVTSSTTSSILISDDIIRLSGISSIFAGDLLRIDDEIVKVRTVGYGQTNSILVDRAWMGTGISSHISNSPVTKLFGSYNIVNNTINFVESPYGLTPVETSSPNELDWTGISTYSTFTGRIFLRSGFEGTANEAYSTNYVLDDISGGFNGIKTDFILKSEGNDISGIVTSNGIFLVNQIAQEPQRLTVSNPILGNYFLEESAGITTINFKNGGITSTYDINSSNIPKGGIIVSVGSSKGFGYQPLVSAGGTSVVSSAGTIQSISIGNSGSGYRVSSQYEIETFVSSNIGIGSTIIYLQNKNSVFNVIGKLNTGSNCSIDVGGIISETPIISVGSSFVTIGIGSTSSTQISGNTSVVVKITNPNLGIVNVGVVTSLTGVSTTTHVGFATIKNGNISSPVYITNSGFGYTSSNPPIVVFDDPDSYSNIPLTYSNSSSIGFGTGAIIDIVVGQGSSIIDFEIKNFGYGYGQGEILTVDTTSITGIPTVSNSPISEFNITIEKTSSDTFSAWIFGDLKIFDSINGLFNGNRRVFPLTIDAKTVSIKPKVGSLIDVQEAMIVFVNDILQVPGESYTFDGGSVLVFSEPPKENDTCTILFYEGTSSVDVAQITPTQKIKVGDFVEIEDDSINFLSEDSRIITDVNSVDSVKTNIYPGPGISQNESLLRPITLYQQTEDLFINGKLITKDRLSIEPNIQPTTNIIEPVSAASTQIYVETVKTFFDSKKEYPINQDPQDKIIIVSQDTIKSADVSVVISPVGIVSSILITDGGIGYDSDNPPTITIQNPIGLNSESAAKVTTNVSSAGTVFSLNIDSVGIGYTTDNAPLALVEPPTPKAEVIDNISYYGDFGSVVGYGLTMIGIVKYKVFDLYIPEDSSLRDDDIVGTGITISQLDIGDYFVIKNSNVSISTENYSTYRNDDSLIGISTQYIDAIYQVSNFQILQSSITGIGTTFIKRVIVRSSDTSTIGLSTVGMGSSVITFDSTYYRWDYFDTSSLIEYSKVYYGGEFTWGKISNLNRQLPKEFNSYGGDSISGITTSATVTRFNPLKYNQYV